VLAVGLALASAALFGAMTVALRFALNSSGDAEVGALVCAAVALGVAALAAVAAGGSLGTLRDVAVFAGAGAVAPGLSQIFFVRAIGEAGAARASVVVGCAPLVAAVLGLTLLGEPAKAGVLTGGLLVVLGGIALLSERVRPETFRAVGLLFGVAATVLFASRDAVVRGYSDNAEMVASTASAVALAGGVAAIYVYLLTTRRAFPRVTRSAALAFLPAGLFFGLSYILLFEAFYRGRVTVVTPLVATESLWTVVLAALLMRRSELVGRRLLLGAFLVVAGSALIGLFR
jgi:drug/metabolite transporter (DMT)-like permease